MKYLTIVFLALGLIGCGQEDGASNADIQEIGQQAGGAMAAVDESSGKTDGGFAKMEIKGFNRMHARLQPPSTIEKVANLLKPAEAHAESCATAPTFGTCSSGQIVRDFGGCTIGLGTFTGSVTLDFSDSSCLMGTAGNNVSRTPAFTVTGYRGATLTVSKTGTVGQQITKGVAAGEFAFSNDGINRVFTLANGNDIVDFTTRTTSDIGITGASRSTRIIDGGALEITNNISENVCTITPNALTWTTSCNCATSGSWTGSCSSGDDVSLTVTGCGTADLVVGEKEQSFNFDKCYAL